MNRFLVTCLVGLTILSSVSFADTRGPEESRFGESDSSYDFDIPKVRENEEEKSCCDRCFDAAVDSGRNPGGLVCCCEDDTGDVGPEACSFADKYPRAWPAGPGQDILDACILEHEQGHIDDGEGVCTNIDDGNPSVWGPGQDHDTCEPNQYKQEIECLKNANCNNNAQCAKMVKDRIDQLDKAFNLDTCTEHCPSP